jgi:hypothetical protein
LGILLHFLGICVEGYNHIAEFSANRVDYNANKVELGANKVEFVAIRPKEDPPTHHLTNDHSVLRHIHRHRCSRRRGGSA